MKSYHLYVMNNNNNNKCLFVETETLSPFTIPALGLHPEPNPFISHYQI